MSEKVKQAQPNTIIKLMAVAFVVFIAVFLDQWTKMWAEENLASPRYEHTVDVEVP